ncbi:hypothetical protein AN963_16495 [Brevibacillus choshinensis]|uniref:Uncharacterized protein n=1 Tax=Brevibacillus choshinensis TaxID=54911 RepID=A0ABR5N7B4_BRECH|nr:hypothetical protein [Brevibacillus choshinensis]KQL46526.1 hypothetical protein AN963_16495 [Brevibacillus choshinensis]
MRLYAAGQEYVLENNSGVVETVLDIINQAVEEQSLVFCGFQIDGEEYYGELADLVTERGDSIETMVAIMLTEEQLKEDTLLSVEQYLCNALPLLETLYHDFYNGPSAETWNDLGKLIESIEWISKVAEYTDSHSILEYREEVSNLEMAVNQQDTGLIGDIIQFEIIPRFEKARDALSPAKGGKSIDTN